MLGPVLFLVFIDLFDNLQSKVLLFAVYVKIWGDALKGDDRPMFQEDLSLL